MLGFSFRFWVAFFLSVAQGGVFWAGKTPANDFLMSANNRTNDSPSLKGKVSSHCSVFCCIFDRIIKICHFDTSLLFKAQIQRWRDTETVHKTCCGAFIVCMLLFIVN